MTHWAHACRYDCSSADLNPIGAISKNDLKRFLVWASEHLGYSELQRVVAAPPTAELEPIREGVTPQVCPQKAPGHSCAPYKGKVTRCKGDIVTLTALWSDRMRPCVLRLPK